MSSYLCSVRALYATDYTRRSRICKGCAAAFSDVTPRSLMRSCSKACTIASMVATRHARGSYVRTVEQNLKTAVSVRATHASRDCFGPELRKKFSETMKASWRDGKIDATNHWAKTPEGRARISANCKGKKLGPQPNMSLAARARLRTKRETLYTSARGGFRDDLGQYFRSGWEANVARVLTYQGKRWEYETKTFELEPNLSYTPDFYLPDDDVYYEVKGRMDEKSENQFRLMEIKHPDAIIVVIGGEIYAKLRLEYKHLVAWEGK